MGLTQTLLYETGKKAAKKGREALSDPAFEALANSWNNYFQDTEIDTDDLFVLLTDEEVKQEVKRFEREGKFELSVIAKRIESLYQDYNPNLNIDGFNVAEEIVYNAEPELPGDTQQKIQTSLTRRILRLKEESKDPDESIRLQDDLNHSKEEKIFSNILSVENIPSKIFFGVTDYRNKSKVYSDFEDEDLPSFVLREGKIYSFANLRGTKLKEIVNGDISTIKPEKWRKDPDKKYYLLSLMNSYLSSYLWDLGLRKRGNNFYFFPSDEKRVEANWNYKVKKSNRWLVKYEGGYFRHKAVDVSFSYIGEELFLQIQPRICLSKDGYHDVDQKTKNRATSSGQNFNRNKQQFTDVRFWIQLFTQENECINLGNGLKVRNKPLNYNSDFRLERDYIEPDRPFTNSKVKVFEKEVNEN
jgi:hypothetical protein